MGADFVVAIGREDRVLEGLGRQRDPRGTDGPRRTLQTMGEVTHAVGIGFRKPGERVARLIAEKREEIGGQRGIAHRLSCEVKSIEQRRTAGSRAARQWGVNDVWQWFRHPFPFKGRSG